MPARLFCKTGQLAGASYEIDREATLGKGAENTIQLYPTIVSGKHARIFFDAKISAWFIEDLKSRNGTRIDGVRVNGMERLDALNVITFADKLDFVFQVFSGVSPSPVEKKQKTVAPAPVVVKPPKQEERKTVMGDDAGPLPVFQDAKPDRARTVYDDQPIAVPELDKEPKKEPQQEPAKADKAKTVVGTSFEPAPRLDDKKETPDVSPQAMQFVLELQNAKQAMNSFMLREGENSIGREPANTIQIDDGSISRKHAILILAGGRVTVKDLGSKNATMLNNERVNYEMEVRSGSTLIFGIVKAVLKKQ
ncbi:MAG: FHA domain-containing protein [Bacteroidota bacterium]